MDVVCIDDNQYTTSFTDYLRKNSGKFVAIISPQQYAIEIEKDFSHEGMLADLIKRTRPDMKMDSWGNALDPNNDFKNDTITVLGYPGYVQIELPLKQLLSFGQYKYLHDILNAIREYNKQTDKDFGQKYDVLAFGFGLIDIEAKYYKDNISELINKIMPFVSDKPYQTHENIIGRELDNGKNDDVLLVINDNKNDDLLSEQESELKFKGYSNILILIFLTSIVSILILLLGVFIDMN